MNNPSNGFVQNIWCSMGKPFRNSLIMLSNMYKYNIRDIPNPFMDMKKLIEKDNPVIVDGGANNGGTITTFKQYFPKSTILAFEPLESLGLEENTKEFDNVYIEYLALGEENKYILFNEMNYPDTSSVFIHRESDTLQHLKVKEKKKVNMISLDSWSEKEHFKDIDIIKLDLQGYELNALKGAKRLLSSSVKLVYVECSFKEFYINQPLFCDIYQFMTSCGFEIYNIYRDSPEQSLGFVDVLFTKRL